jgi:signal transduction histidine kinase
MTPGSAPSALAARITHNRILAVLASGFALVILLLLAAAVIAVRSGREIQTDAEQLVHEQGLTARLVNQMRVEQATLNSVFYQLTRNPDPTYQADLLRQLDSAGDSISRLARNAGATPEARLWRDLDRSAQAFTAQARDVIMRDNTTSDAVQTLFKQHEEVMGIVRNLTDASYARARLAELRVAKEARQVVDESFALLGGGLILAVICAVMTLRFATTLFRRMETQASELSRVSWHMLRGQEEAARRFSHELHDELGQSLSAVKANLALLNIENLEQRRADCMRLVNDSISNVRELSQLLRPVILDDFGLDAGLRWLSEKFGERTGIAVQYESELNGRLPDDTETHLFRIAQEALTNVARHSGANRVNMRLTERDNKVFLAITDNGSGLKATTKPRNYGIGMVGMRARARHAGGDFAVHEVKAGGLEIEVWVPAIKVEDNASEQNTHPVGR